MEVQVMDGLSGLLAAVGYHPEIGDAHLLGHLGDDGKGMGHHTGVVRGDLAAGADMLLGDDQEVVGAWGSMS